MEDPSLNIIIYGKNILADIHKIVDGTNSPTLNSGYPDTHYFIEEYSGWKYFLISLLFGWWGIPWGPIYTFQSLFYAFRGKNMTTEMLDAIIEDHQQSQDENNSDLSQDEQSQMDSSQDEQMENDSQNYASQDPFEMADPKNNRVDTDFK